MMQLTIDSLQKVKIRTGHVTYGHAREGKIYKYCLRLFIKTELKDIKFDSCPSCGGNKFVKLDCKIGYHKCKACYQVVGDHQRTPNKKQLALIALIMKELGIVARRHDITHIRQGFAF